MTVRIPPDVDRLLITVGVLLILFGPVSAGGGGDVAVVLIVSQLLAWGLALTAVFGLVRDSSWAMGLLPPLAAAVLLIGMLDAVQGNLAYGASHVIGGSLALVGSILLLRRPSPSRLPLPDRFVSAAPALPDDPQATRVPESDFDPLLEAFMAEAARLSREEARRLATLWRSGDAAARRLAWRAVRRMTSGRGRHREDLRGQRLDELRSRVVELGLTAEGSVWTWFVGTMEDVDRGDLRRATVPALLDAGAALILRDRLDTEDFDVLYGPWRQLQAVALSARRLHRGRRHARSTGEPQAS